MSKVQILDYGSLELVESWGSDERIIEAARMSTNKGFQGWGPKDCANCGFPTSNPAYVDCCPDGSAHDRKPGDEKLLRYLWENAHHTPFEMGGFTIEVQAPIFVFREWHRHRVPFGYNEASARYIALPDINYIPSTERLLQQSEKNRQAQSTGAKLTEADAVWFQIALANVYEADEALYQEALKRGVPKELARTHLPVGRYSRMRATSNLRGWLGFLKLRMAPNAQYEIRMYANAVGDLVAQLFPRTWELFCAGRN